ncbi:MAG TPA: PAS domain S-box protein, partial [Solirubrobacteraceae bacterium]|nr:PAS domain S-box protein [Solirubrobacteraceae bacterium]
MNEIDLGGLALAALRAFPGSCALVFDRELRVLLTAGEGSLYTGTAPGELEGRSAAEALAGGSWEAHEPLFRAALRGETRSLEVWSADETACYEVEVAPLRSQGAELLGGVAVWRDVTHAKHAEEARRHAQERFELVFEEAPIGMALVTQEGRWVRVNEALLKITGYTAEELQSKTLEEVTHPDDISTDLEHVRRLLAGEIEDYEVPKRFFHARGHIISAVLTMGLVRDRRGKPLHFIAQIQDITESKLMEERLRRLAEQDALTGLRN